MKKEVIIYDNTQLWEQSDSVRSMLAAEQGISNAKGDRAMNNDDNATKTMWFFTEDGWGQRNGVDCDDFKLSDIVEPHGKGRGYENKERTKLLFEHVIYNDFD